MAIVVQISIQDLIFWDPSKYINIYIVYQFNSNNNSGITLGPWESEIWGNDKYNAIFLNYWTVDPTYNDPTWGGDTSYELEGYRHTISHEMGHYLGLRHTWGDFCNSNCCSIDDFDIFKNEIVGMYPNDFPIPFGTSVNDYVDNNFNDTPNASTYSLAYCNTFINTCTDNSDNDLIDNFMDYSYCPLTFSEGQVSLMDLILQSDIGYRSSLHSQETYDCVFNTCVDPVSSDLVLTNSKSANAFNAQAPNFAGQTVVYLYKKAGSQLWQYKYADGGNVTAFTNLSTCTHYLVKMAVVCDGSWSPYVNGSIITGKCLSGKNSNEDGTIGNGRIGLNIYPNPADTKFTVEVADVENLNEIFITDITGKKISITPVAQQNNALQFEVGSLAPGYYILSVVDMYGQTESSKLLINK